MAARQAASGKLDLEAWRDPGLEDEELSRRIRALDGFGPYATEHLLRLLGRHEHLALDSWNRRKVARLRGVAVENLDPQAAQLLSRPSPPPAASGGEA